MKFGPRTIRAKLTLITMLVMGGLLGVFGVSVDFAAHKAVIQSINNDLLNRAQAMAHGPGGPHGFGGPGGPHGPDGPPPGGWGDHGPGGPPPNFDQGHGPDQHDGPWMSPPTTQPAKGPNQPNSNPDRRGGPPQLTAAQKVEMLRQMDKRFTASQTNPGLPPQHFMIGGNNYGQRCYSVAAFALAKSTKEPAFEAITKDGKAYEVLDFPVMNNGKLERVDEMTSPLEESNKTLVDLRRVLISIIIPVGMVLSGLASLYLISRLTQPLRVITSNADAIGAHNAAERLPVVGRDEFASVSTTLNSMLDRLEAGLRLEQMTNRQLEQTVLQQRRFTEDASHELKTPLAVIKANTGLMLHYGGSEAEMRESVQTIEAAADRMNRMVQDLLVLARAEAGQLAPKFEQTDLHTVVQDSISHLAFARDRVTVTEPPAPIRISASPDHLSRVFVNLIDNALRHSGSECPVEVQLLRTETHAIAVIRDHGEGIAPEHLPRLFDRFYRTDRSRSSDTGGTGLGLAICKGIIEAHHGTIEVSSIVGEGTAFTVTIPIA